MYAQNHPLLGTWKLISVSATLPDGTVEEEIYGSNPKGYITYTGEGCVIVILSRSDRQPLSKDIQSPFSRDSNLASIAESANAFSSFSAYAGTYTLTDNTVIHHIEISSIPNRVGIDLVRTFTVHENKIILKTPPTLSDGVSKTFELVWQRV